VLYRSFKKYTRMESITILLNIQAETETQIEMLVSGHQTKKNWSF
jgi:hypothetical protein